MSRAIPPVCGHCNFVKPISVDTESGPMTLYVCSHKKSKDREGRRLYVMTNEEPDALCPLRKEIFVSMITRLKQSLFKGNDKKLSP